MRENYFLRLFVFLALFISFSAQSMSADYQKISVVASSDRETKENLDLFAGIIEKVGDNEGVANFINRLEVFLKVKEAKDKNKFFSSITNFISPDDHIGIMSDEEQDFYNRLILISQMNSWSLDREESFARYIVSFFENNKALSVDNKMKELRKELQMDPREEETSEVEMLFVIDSSSDSQLSQQSIREGSSEYNSLRSILLNTTRSNILSYETILEFEEGINTLTKLILKMREERRPGIKAGVASIITASSITLPAIGYLGVSIAALTINSSSSTALVSTVTSATFSPGIVMVAVGGVIKLFKNNWFGFFNPEIKISEIEAELEILSKLIRFIPEESECYKNDSGIFRDLRKFLSKDQLSDDIV